MNDESVRKYLAMMDEIKRRTAVIRALNEGKAHLLYDTTSIESMYLQLRKVLELIAFGSLAANKDLYSQVHAGFARDWNPKRLLERLEGINPHFFPEPIHQHSSDDPNIVRQWLNRTGDFLTKDDLITLYNRCGMILHAENPYGSRIDYKGCKAEVTGWCEQIYNLLNAHLIRLIGDPNLYLIQMGAEGSPPSYNAFSPVSREVEHTNATT